MQVCSGAASDFAFDTSFGGLVAPEQVGVLVLRLSGQDNWDDQ